jgi:hypothetical protein
LADEGGAFYSDGLFRKKSSKSLKKPQKARKSQKNPEKARKSPKNPEKPRKTPKSLCPALGLMRKAGGEGSAPKDRLRKIEARFLSFIGAKHQEKPPLESGKLSRGGLLASETREGLGRRRAL